MKFQIASDIHIEKIYPKCPEITDYIIPSSENLILAGDIGSIYHYEIMKNFFISCKNNFENVLFVPGNNEYYLREGFEMKTFDELNKDLRKLSEETGVIVLINEYIEDEEYIIFGTTWWSFIPEVLNMKIHIEKDRQINSDDFNYLHCIARKCLNKLVERKGDKKLIVISHYCPTRLGTMNLHHKNEDFTDLVPYYFSSSEKYLRGDVDTWIYGHTHVFRDFLFDGGNTRIISNADPRKRFFIKDFVVEL